jgi:hypothetical protein
MAKGSALLFGEPVISAICDKLNGADGYARVLDRLAHRFRCKFGVLYCSYWSKGELIV